MSAEQHLHPEANIQYFATFVVAGLLVAIVFHSLMRVIGFEFPWDTFLFNPADRHNDWHNSVVSAATLNPYYERSHAVSTYFPFTYVALLSGAGLSEGASYLVYALISATLLTAGIVLFWRYQVLPLLDARQDRIKPLLHLLAASFLSYPVIFALDRGSLDIWIGGLCVIYVALLKTRLALMGCIALGLAIAMKGYPLVFLLLALVDRKYLLSLVTVLVALMLTLLSLVFLGDGLVHNLTGLSIGLEDYRRIYVIGVGSLHYSSDPYNGIRALLSMLHHAYKEWREIGLIVGAEPDSSIRMMSAAVPLNEQFSSMRFMFLRVYTLVSSAFAVVCVLFALAVPAARWRRVMVVCLVAILFPHVANDYKLVVLFPGILVLLSNSAERKRSTSALTLVALLMIPKHYLFIYGKSISMLINPALLICLAFCVMWDRAAWRRGIRLLRFRTLWYLAPLLARSPANRVLAHLRFPAFLRKHHKSMQLT